MTRFFLMSCATVLVAAAGNVMAQACNNRINATAPTHRFEIDGAVAHDKRTGLTWLRCPISYVFEDGGTPDVWADDVCSATGSGVFQWAAGLRAAAALDAAGSSAWRVPDGKELLSVVERKCVSPAVNLDVFPRVLTGHGVVCDESQHWR